MRWSVAWWGQLSSRSEAWTPIVWSGFGKILIFIIISPLVGFLIGGMLMVLVAWAFRNKSPHQAGKWFKYGQLFAAGRLQPGTWWQ
jgi:PiT family inorganic phosphate transporter